MPGVLDDSASWPTTADHRAGYAARTVSGCVSKDESALMPKDDKLELEGVVDEALPNAMFRVKCDVGSIVLATISGKMRKFSIRILPGDRVTVESSPYDPSRGRITYQAQIGRRSWRSKYSIMVTCVL